MSGFGARIQRGIMGAFMGAAVGGGGVVVGSMIQVGRMPPRMQVYQAAGFMSCVFGFGSMFRG